MSGSPASRSCSKYHEATRFRNADAAGSRPAGTGTGVSTTVDHLPDERSRADGRPRTGRRRCRRSCSPARTARLSRSGRPATTSVSPGPGRSTSMVDSDSRIRPSASTARPGCTSSWPAAPRGRRPGPGRSRRPHRDRRPRRARAPGPACRAGSAAGAPRARTARRTGSAGRSRAWSCRVLLVPRCSSPPRRGRWAARPVRSVSTASWPSSSPPGGPSASPASGTRGCTPNTGVGPVPRTTTRTRSAAGWSSRTTLRVRSSGSCSIRTMSSRTQPRSDSDVTATGWSASDPASNRCRHVQAQDVRARPLGRRARRAGRRRRRRRRIPSAPEPGRRRGPRSWRSAAGSAARTGRPRSRPPAGRHRTPAPAPRSSASITAPGSACGNSDGSSPSAVYGARSAASRAASR